MRCACGARCLVMSDVAAPVNQGGSTWIVEDCSNNLRVGLLGQCGARLHKGEIEWSGAIEPKEDPLLQKA